MSWEYDYNEKAKTYKENDYWRQVRRTINGSPVSEDQIKLIVYQISKLLNLNSEDNLLDLGCGNGALTNYFKEKVNISYGIDSSEYLINVAKSNFQSSKNFYEKIGIEEFIDNKNFDAFNKVIIYGVSSFLEDNLIEKIFQFMASKSNKKIMIGNVRDINAVDYFYKTRPKIEELNSCKTSMGKWRNIDWFKKTASKYNLTIKTYKMPKNFYASDYYFDLIIENGS